MPWSELECITFAWELWACGCTNRLFRDVQSESRLTSCLVSGTQCCVCLGYAGLLAYSTMLSACSGIEKTPAC